MQERNRYLIAISGIVLTATLGLGGVASAAGDDDAGTRRPQLTTQERCDKSDEIRARAVENRAKVGDRIEALEVQRAEAEAAGNTTRVERLDRRMARLERVGARLDERLARLDTWVAEHCTA